MTGPVAAFISDVAGLYVAFDATSSTATSPATLTLYSWDFGDGNTDTGATPTHTYATAGTNTVGLTVTDSNSLFDTVTGTVTVVLPAGSVTSASVAADAWTASAGTVQACIADTDPATFATSSTVPTALPFIVTFAAMLPPTIGLGATFMLLADRLSSTSGTITAQLYVYGTLYSTVTDVVIPAGSGGTVNVAPMAFDFPAADCAALTTTDWWSARVVFTVTAVGAGSTVRIAQAFGFTPQSVYVWDGAAWSDLTFVPTAADTVPVTDAVSAVVSGANVVNVTADVAAIRDFVSVSVIHPYVHGPGAKLEVEFTTGVWSDVTADMDYTAGYSIRVGRTSPQQQPQTSTATVQLRNPTGKYTPGLQVLSDGTAAPYYPNVVPRRRLRISTVYGVRFVGLIKSWSPALVNGVTGVCVTAAADRMDQLAGVTMLAPLAQEYGVDAPTLWWPLTDQAGSTAALEQSGNRGPALTRVQEGTGGSMAFGDTGPGAGDGTGLLLTPADISNGVYLHGLWRATRSTIMPATLELWVNKGTLPGATVTVFSLYDAGEDEHASIRMDPLGRIVAVPRYGSTITSAARVVDGAWHLVTVTNTAGTVRLYIDGAYQGYVVVTAAAVSRTGLRLGQADQSNPSALVSAHLGQLAIFPVPLTPERVAAHYSAGMAWVGETTSQRVARFLGYTGLTAADWALDTSTVTLGSYPQGGKDVLAACQDMAVTEGGGSVFYVLAGMARFTSRTYRKPGTATLTVDAVKDSDRNTYQPSMDDQSLANSSTVTRATEAGAATTVTVTDAASIALYGLATGDVTTYTDDDGDALNLAQSIVSEGRTPGLRLSQIAVDLLTSENDLYASAQAVQIGSRLREVALPAAAMPSTQLDVIVEGWTETGNVGTYQLVFDTSPADNPPRAVWDDPTYGRWSPAPDCALNAAITNTATTVVIKSPTGATFTTVSARYPLNVQIGAEVVTLTTAPAGSSSPQTFTGVTRGAAGTTAAAQPINTRVQLVPANAWAL